MSTMSSVLSYIKKKIKPFRRCVFDSSSSFVQNDMSREKNRARDQSSHLQVNNLTITTKSQIGDSTTDQSRLSKNIFKSRAARQKMRFFASNQSGGGKSKMSKQKTEDNIAIKASSYYCTPEHSPESQAVSCVNLKSAAGDGQITPISIDPEDTKTLFKTFGEENSAHMLYNTPVSSAHSSSTPSLSISARNRKLNVNAVADSTGASSSMSKTPSAPNSSPMSNISDSISFNDHISSPESTGLVPDFSAESSSSRMVANVRRAASNGQIKILLNDESNLNTLSLNSNSNSMQQSTPFNENSPGKNRTKLIKNEAAKNENAKSAKQTSICSSADLETPQVSSIGLHGSSLNHLNSKDFTSTDDNEYSSSGQDMQQAKKKCHRSNTTYTVKAAAMDNRKNKIIDYFNHLQFNKATISKAKSSESYMYMTTDSTIQQQQQQFNSKPLNQKLFEKTTDDEDRADTEDEIEKIQDALFKDESYLSTGSKAKRLLAANELKNDNISSFLLQSSLSSMSSIERSNENLAAEKLREDKLSAKKFNDETHLVDKSIEKMRRSISMPGLNDHNTTVFSNMSKISMLKDIETEASVADDELTKSNHQVSMMQHEEEMKQIDELEARELDMNEHAFVRGESQARMSSNIKSMFNNVRKYQMNALNCLEKYHESQLNKLEIERNTRLLLSPNDQEQINAYFDQQKILIEQRIYSNLCFITQNKSSHGESNGSLNTQKSVPDLMPNQARYSTESSKSARQSVMQYQQMNHQAQLYMLQAQKANGPKSIQQIKRPVIQQHQLKQQSKSRAKSLSGLKSNMINQKSMLVSKSQASAFSSSESRYSYAKFKMNKINSTSNEEFERDNFFVNMRSNEAPNDACKSITQDFEDEQTGFSSIHQDVETEHFQDANGFVFKRHLSLPYEKCGHHAAAQMRRISNNSRKNACHQPMVKMESKVTAVGHSNFSTLTYSASRTKYYKRNGAGGMNTSSTFTSGSSLASREQEAAPTEGSFLSKNSSMNSSLMGGGPNSKLTSTQLQFHYLKNRLLQKSLANSGTSNETYLKPGQISVAQQQRSAQMSSYAQIKRLTGSPTTSIDQAQQASPSHNLAKPPVSQARPTQSALASKVYMKKETEV